MNYNYRITKILICFGDPVWVFIFCMIMFPLHTSEDRCTRLLRLCEAYIKSANFEFLSCKNGRTLKLTYLYVLTACMPLFVKIKRWLLTAVAFPNDLCNVSTIMSENTIICHASRHMNIILKKYV